MRKDTLANDNVMPRDNVIHGAGVLHALEAAGMDLVYIVHHMQGLPQAYIDKYGHQTCRFLSGGTCN